MFTNISLTCAFIQIFLQTQEQIFDMLISFFPHVLIDVYDFLVKKGISIEKISEDLCYF